MILKVKTKAKDLILEAKAKYLTFKAKAKDLTSKVKAKDMSYCPRGAFRLTTWTRGLQHWLILSASYIVQQTSSDIRVCRKFVDSFWQYLRHSSQVLKLFSSADAIVFDRRSKLKRHLDEEIFSGLKLVWDEKVVTTSYRFWKSDIDASPQQYVKLHYVTSRSFKLT